MSCKGGSELGRYWLICLCTDTKLNTSTQHSITLHNQIARRGWQLELFSLLLRALFQEEIKNQFSFLLFCRLQLGSTIKNAQSIIFFRSTNVTNVNYVFNVGEYLNNCVRVHNNDLVPNKNIWYVKNSMYFCG